MDNIVNSLNLHQDLTVKLLQQYQTVQKPEFLNSPINISALIGPGEPGERVYSHA